MNHKTIILRNTLLLTLASALTACGGSDEVSARATKLAKTQTATKVIASDSPEHPLPDARGQATTDLSIETVEDLRLAAQRVRDARPRFYEAVMQMQPRPTRNHLLRYIEPELHEADAAAIFALRLLDEPEAPKLERMAMVDAVARAAGNFGPYLVVLLPAEADPDLRSTLIDQLRRAEPEAAKRGLELALVDAEPVVRESAFRTLASQHELRGAMLGENIIAGLSDADPAVRSSAAFAARVRGEEIALDQLLALAKSDEGDARIQALRAIDSIDSSRLDEVDLVALSQSDDQRVSRFASQTLASRAN
jgi:HEAT repeat protein